MVRKSVKSIITLLFVLLCIQAFSINCLAMNTGFELQDINQEDAEAMFNNKSIEPVNEKEITTGFCCFDVSESGNYALGFDLGNLEKVIMVYDQNGDYLYGISFEENGSFGFEWSADDIVIYTVRGDLAICVNSSGQLVEMKSISDTSQNREYWYNEINANSRTVNGVTYNAEHWLNWTTKFLHWGEYPRLVKIGADGQRTVLFDNSETFGTFIIWCFVIGGILVVSVLCIFVRLIIKKRETGNTGNTEHKGTVLLC